MLQKLFGNRPIVVVLRAGAILGIASGAILFSAGTHSSAATTGGTVTLVAGSNSGDSSGTITDITSGVSDTPFGVQLQNSATDAQGNPGTAPDCSGTTASGATNVYTYLIKSGEDPTKLDFKAGEPGTLPDSSEVLALFTTGGLLETDSSTQVAASPSGQIALPPTMAYSFGQIVSSNGGGVPASDLLYQSGGTSGAWDAGWACFKSTSAGQLVTDYWQFAVTFTKTSGGTGDKEDFSWAASSSSTGATTTTTSTSTSTTTTSSTSTTTTTLPGSSTTTTTSQTGGTSTTLASTSTTTLADQTGTTASTPTSSSGGTGTGTGTGTGSDPAGGVSVGSSGGTVLANTGAPVKRDVSLALLAMILGILCLMVSLVIGGDLDGILSQDPV